jgi:hypothetical protein
MVRQGKILQLAKLLAPEACFVNARNVLRTIRTESA